MSLAEGLMAGLAMQKYIAEAPQKAEESRLRAQFYKAQAQHHDVESKRIAFTLRQAERQQRQLREAFMAQAQDPAAEAAPQGPAARVASPQIPLSGGGMPAEDAQALQDFSKRYGGTNTQQELEAFSQRFQTPARAPDLSPQQNALVHRGGGNGTATLEATEAQEEMDTAAGDTTTPEDLPTLQGTAPGGSSDDERLLRRLSQIFFSSNQPQLGIPLLKYASEVRDLKETARFFKEILQNPGASKESRQGAVSALGALLIKSGHLADGLRLLGQQLPLSTREVLERASLGVRDELLSQLDQGQPLDIPAALEAKERKDLARQEARKPQGKAAKTPPPTLDPDDEIELRLNLSRLSYLAHGDPKDPRTKRAQEALAELRELRRTGAGRKGKRGGPSGEPEPSTPTPDPTATQPYEGRGTSPPAPTPEPELPAIKSFKRVR